MAHTSVVLPQGPTIFYHYTTKECATAIMRECLIRQSTADDSVDAVNGNGTYLNLSGPDNPAKMVAHTNWAGELGNTTLMMKSGRTDAVIRIEMQGPEASKVKQLPSDRDLYLYPGNIMMYDKNYKVYFRNDKGVMIQIYSVV